MRISITFETPSGGSGTFDLTQVTSLRYVSTRAVVVNEVYKLVCEGRVTQIRQRSVDKRWHKMFLNETTGYYQ